jgi:hypothetical protein
MSKQRITIDASQFDRLVRGEVIETEGAQICLNDIGFGIMAQSIRQALGIGPTLAAAIGLSLNFERTEHEVACLVAFLESRLKTAGEPLKEYDFLKGQITALEWVQGLQPDPPRFRTMYQAAFGGP